MADIVGIEGLSVDEVRGKVEEGGRFVIYSWALSVIVLTIRRPSAIHFVHPGESAALKGLPYTLLSFFVGWWGFPWGIIYTPMVIATNLSGGKDVTAEVMRTIDTSWHPRAPSGSIVGALPAAPAAPSNVGSIAGGGVPATVSRASVDTDARASLYLGLVGILCFPLGWLGAFFAIRAVGRAKAHGSSAPATAWVGLGLAALTTLCFTSTLLIGALSPPKERPAPVVQAPPAGVTVQPGASDDQPRLPLRITKVYRKQKPTERAPYHAAGGDWTFADAEGDDGVALTFGVRVDAKTEDGPFGFGDAQLSVPDAAHGAAFVRAFDAAFGGDPGDAKPAAKPGPLKMRAAILGQHQQRLNEGGFADGKTGTWTATKLFPQLGEHQGEVFFNYSLDEQQLELAEKDADYADDLSYVFSSTFGKR